MKHVLYQLVVFAISSTLLACATAGDDYESAGDPVANRSNDCILQSSIRDYQVLDDRNLIVTASGRREYHVELSRRAQGLRSSWSIGFDSPSGMICRGSAEIFVDDGFGRGERIRLSSVRALSDDERDTLLVQFGKKEPDVEHTPEPDEVDGAEVEELD